MTAVC